MLAFDAAPTDRSVLLVEDREPPVRLALVRPSSWDPHEVSIADRAAAIVSDLLYDGLTEAGTGDELVPALAESWVASDDLTVWTFDLDQERVLASEVVANFTALGSSATTPATSAVLDEIETVVAIDESTVEFSLLAPNGGFPWLLSGVPLSVVGDAGPTGRYSLSQTDLGLELTGRDGTRDLVIRWYATELEAESAVAADEADVALATLGGATESGTRLEFSVRSMVRYVQVNVSSPEVADSAVRVSAARSIDGGFLAELLGPLAVAQTGFVPSAVAGAADLVCGLDCVDSAEAGSSPRRGLVVGGLSGQENFLSAVADELTVGGFAAGPIVLSVDEFESELIGGTIDYFSGGWVAEAGSLDGWLPLLTENDQVEAFRIPEVDELVAQARRVLDDEERWAILRAAAELLVGGGVVVPVAALSDATVIRSGIESISIEADGTLKLDQQWRLPVLV